MIKKISRGLLAVVAASAMLTSVASANLLVNSGFEDPGFDGAESFDLGPGWSGFGNFGGPLRIQCPGSSPGDPCIEPIGSATGANDGIAVLKAFGTSGAFQDFAASEGESFSGSVHVLNPDNGDFMRGGMVAFALIIFFDAAGAEINGATQVSDIFTEDATKGIWNLLEVTGIAPPNTATVRFQFMADFQGGDGAPRFDDAFFDRSAVVPVPAAVWLMGSALFGLAGLRRKKV